MRKIKCFIYIFAKRCNSGAYRIVDGMPEKIEALRLSGRGEEKTVSTAYSRSGYARPLNGNYPCGLFPPLPTCSRRSWRSWERSVGCVLLVFRERRMFSQGSVDGKLSLAPEIIAGRGQRTWIRKNNVTGLSDFSYRTHFTVDRTDNANEAIRTDMWYNSLFDNVSPHDCLRNSNRSRDSFSVQDRE